MHPPVTQKNRLLSKKGGKIVIWLWLVMITQKVVGLRVPEQEENRDGLDLGSHGESSYHL